jgi:hypothetical protein
LLDCLTDVKLLRDDQQARAGGFRNESAEMGGHGFAIMRNQDFQIFEVEEVGSFGCLEIQRRLTSEKSCDDLRV